MALAQQLLRSGRGVNGSAYFVGGMSSASDPMFLDDRSYRSSMNTVNRGGVVQTRPGYLTHVTLPSGRLQGCRYFRPIDTKPYVASAVNGKVYLTQAPFSAWRELENVQFNRGAGAVYWEVATKSVQREADGSLTIIQPKRILLMQDGFSRAAYWDGTTARHLDPSPSAFAEATRNGDVLASIDVTAPGAGYEVAPAVNIAPPALPGGVQATATAYVLGGRVTHVVITNPGSGYDEDPAVYFSGTKNETPIGGPMCWSGDRLWVAQGNKLFASDISDPLSFTENIYAAEGGFFLFPEPIVAMAELPAIEVPQLLVFTNTQTWIIQSGIRDRSRWKSTDNFQRLLFPGIGASGHRAVTSQYGLLWWFTMTGLTNFNAASQARISSELRPKDAEMAQSKGNLAQNVRDVALAAFENYLLCSVPSGHRYNRHTWVMDGAVTPDGAPAWNSIWTGTKPVEWTAGPVDGVQRLFYVSADGDGRNRLWEAFSPDRKDNGLAITASVETKTHIDFGEKTTGLDLKKIVFAELHFTEIVGDLDVTVYWSGTRGRYKRLASYSFKAPVENWNTGTQVPDGTAVPACLPQSRVVRTPAIEPRKSAGGVQGIESPRLDELDIGFSLLVVWTGRAALRAYRIFADPEQETGTGGTVSAETSGQTVENTVVST